MTRLHLIALPIATALLLSACSGSNDSEHATTAQNRSSSAGLPRGSVEQGEALAHTKRQATGQSCIDCHGVDGNEPLDPTYPKLGGQYADYIAHAMQAYRAGERSHALMSSQALDLTDQQIADLAAYFGSRPSQIVTLEATHSSR